jgi:hypothetical protein
MNPLTKQLRGLILKSWMKYALMSLFIFFPLRIFARIMEFF